MRGTIRHQKNERVRVEARGVGDDALGQNVAPWGLVATLWAYRSAVNGREYVAADALQSEVYVRFQVATRSDITAGMRVVWKGLYHDIKAVVPVAKDMDLITTEGTGDGR